MVNLKIFWHKTSWKSVKQPDLRILGIEEGAESHLLGTENIRNKITEHFLNLKEIQPIEQT